MHILDKIAYELRIEENFLIFTCLDVAIKLLD